MKRRLLMVMLLLVAGAIVNVAVAWGCAARRARLTIERNVQGYFVVWDRPWLIVQERRPGMRDVWWFDLYHENPRSLSAEALVAENNAHRDQRHTSGERLMDGSTVEALAAPPAWGSFGGRPLPTDVYMGGDIAFGAPCLSLWMSTTCDLVSLSTTNDRLHGGWLLRGSVEAVGNRFTALPLRPIYLGFAINTLFYAAILWALFAAPAALRRKRRIKRGLCPKCAYPVGESAVCTECGTPLPSETRQ